MKGFNKILKLSISGLAISLLTGCAAGAATAGYSIKAQSADGLTSEAEQRIINRAKAEILCDMSMQRQFSSQSINASSAE